MKIKQCTHKMVTVINTAGIKEKKEWVKCLDCLLDGIHHYETPTIKEYTTWSPSIYSVPNGVRKIIKKKND